MARWWVWVRLDDGSSIKLFNLVGWGWSFLICYLAHRGSTVGIVLLQCSSYVVRHPRDLHVSVATRCFCRVLIFVLSEYLTVIYLFPVMIHWWVRKPSRGPNNYRFEPWQNLRARLGSRKTGLSPPPPLFPSNFTDRSKAVLLLWFILICYIIYNVCLLHDFVATLRLSALPSALSFVFLHSSTVTTTLR